MYYLVGSSLNLLFEDELANFNNLQKNIICGSITGGIFKSTLGITPMIVGSILGGALIGGTTLIVDDLFQKGHIAF